MTRLPNPNAAGEKLVYVKSVQVKDLPAEVRQHAGDRTILFSVHNEHGERLALVADRGLAFSLARQHEMIPVTVH